MQRRESPLTVAIKGGIAGAIGTAVLTVAMQQGPIVLQQLGLMETPPPGKGGEPTEKLAEKVAGGVLELSLDEQTKQTAGEAIRWTYGAGWGALYGIVQGSLNPPHWLHGTLLGGATAIVASTLVPAMRLTPPPTAQPTAVSVSQFAYHLLYGWVTALVFRILSRSPQE